MSNKFVDYVIFWTFLNDVDTKSRPQNIYTLIIPTVWMDINVF